MTTIKQKIGAYLLPKLPLSSRSFSILRFELAAWRARLAARLNPQTVQRVARWQHEKNLKVNLGCRDVIEGWISLDVRRLHPESLAWDVRHGLPFADNSVSLIYASHVIEHIHFNEDLPRLLRDCYRVLEPNGSIRIVVPDVRRFMEAYLSKDPGQWNSLGFESQPADMPTSICMVNHVFIQDGEHQFGYDIETLDWALMRAGFRSVNQSSYRSSLHDYPQFLDLDCHRLYSLYVEAEK